MLEQIFFGHNAAERKNHFFELDKNRLKIFIFFRFADESERVIFNLANAFAGDVVFLADSIERHASALHTETVAIFDDVLTALSENRKQTLSCLLWFEA